MSSDAIDFDSSALNGLRGLVSIHITLYHSILHSFDVSIYGQVSVTTYLSTITSNESLQDTALPQVI